MKKDLLKTQSKIPYIFIAFFAVVIAVNLAYIYIAKTTWRGVTTENSYQKGLEYNEVIKQEKRQQELGWSVDSRINNIGKRKVAIIVGVLNKDSSMLKDATVSIFFKNPTQEGSDFIAANPSVGNAYRFEVEFPSEGQWDAIILVQKGEDKLYFAKRYVIK